MTNWSWHIYAWVVSGDLLCCLLKREGNWTTDTFFAFYVYCQVKFIHSEKATKFCEISTLDLSYVVTVKSTVEISQNFVAFSEYMNFNLAVERLLKRQSWPVFKKMAATRISRHVRLIPTWYEGALMCDNIWNN